MLTVLRIDRPRPRLWRQRLRHRFRRRGEVTSRPVTLPDGHYLLITAAENRRGQVDWREIRRIAGHEAAHLLLPAGVTPPPDSGIIPFAGQALQQALMLQTAQKLLQMVPTLPRRRIVIDDPQGHHPLLAEALIPHAADLRILTAAPDAYAPMVASVMAQHGACLPVTADPACITDAALVLAPDGLTAPSPLPRGWVLSGVAGSHPRTITGYIPADSAAYMAALPPGYVSWQYLAGLYERSGIHRLGDAPPLTLCAGGQTLSINDAGWRLAGLDIGLSV